MNVTQNSISEIVREVKRLDPSLDRNSPSFKAAVCLLAALQVGAITGNVATFTGYSTKVVRKFSGRLRESGIWVRGKTRSEWFDKKTGIAAFWADVAVALGLLSRIKEKPGRPKKRK